MIHYSDNSVNISYFSDRYAPESLRDGKFSVRSDVWSFGVTMCEMFNCGEQPKLANFDDVDQNGQEQVKELLNALATGAR